MTWIGVEDWQDDIITHQKMVPFWKYVVSH